MRENYEKSIKKSAFISIYCLFILIMAILYISFSGIEIVNKNALVLISFGINGLTWIILMLKELGKHSFSLCLIHWIFLAFFFFIAPVLQYTQDAFPLTSANISNDLIFKVNLFLFLYTVFFTLGSNLIKKKSTQNNEKEKQMILSPCLIIFLTVLCIIFTLNRVVSVGLINMFSRGTSAYAFSNNSAANLITDKVIMSITYFSTIISIHYYLNTNNKIFMIINIINIIIAYFPAGVSRSLTAGIYIGIALTQFPKFRKNHAFVYLFLSAFIFVFPILNVFRHTAIQDVNIIDYGIEIIENFSNEWIKGDYDAYQMLMQTVNYVKNNEPTYGHQLLGVILFFIPRNLWNDKPVGSGYFVADKLGWSFKNVSSPLPAELYINFGFVFSLIIASLLGLAIKYLDEKYWNNHTNTTQSDSIYFYDYFYHYLVGHFMGTSKNPLKSA